MTRPRVTGATAVYGIAGDPVAHSLSPALHAAAFEALGIDAVSVALRASTSAAAAVVDAVRRLGVSGLSVTMPLKAAVVAHCEERSDVVARLGAANCLTATAHGVRADSTDGDGLLGALRCVAGVEVAGARCVVLGAGGAARAAIEALGRGGASDVAVLARRAGAAQEAARLHGVARPGTPADVEGATVVVQATPVGMHDTTSADDEPLIDGAALGTGQLAVELVYHPRVTRWLERAEASGATAVQGVEVLCHQAALALARWLGDDVALGPLHDAVAP